MEDAAAALVDGVEAALPGWVQRSVRRLVLAWAGHLDEDQAAAAADAGRQAVEDVGGRLRSLVSADVDAQTTTPLGIVRDAVRYPTEVLRAAGVPPVQRDEFAETTFPDDVYGLAPASWVDVDPALVELGLAWGAARAMAHRRRHGTAPPAGPPWHGRL